MMTEQLKPTAKISYDHAQVHLAILGHREKYLVTAKNHSTGEVLNYNLIQKEIIPKAEELNNKGFCVWVSLNPKIYDGTSGVSSLADFWLDIDRPKKTKDSDKPATKIELQEALERARTLEQHIEKEYNAIGFLAYSGNGYHLHFPLPITPIDPKQCATINLQVRAFAKKVAQTIGKEIDSTYDINRKTTLIGSQNLKIQNAPLNTSWDSMIVEEGLEKALSFVQTAREQNKDLLEAILNTSPQGQTLVTPSTSKELSEEFKIVPEFDKILEKNITFKEVFSIPEKWQIYNFKSRSEAEQYLCVELMRYGYNPAKVRVAMKLSQVGKWNNPKTEQQYRDVTITKAARFIQQEALKANPELEEKERESQADRLVKLCITQDVELFFDQHNIHYARVKISCDTCDNCETSASLGETEKEILINATAKESSKTCFVPSEVVETSQIPQLRKMPQSKQVIMPIGGSQFKAWLAHLMWLEEEKAPGNDSLNSAINVLKGKASQEGKQYTLYNRVAPALDGIWLDMADAKWRAIKITSEGWKIIDNPPILFRRYSHQQSLAQPAPTQQGDIWKLLDYTTIPKEDDKTRLAFLCTCVSYLIPLIPHPAIVASGPQGSTKSWLFRWIKRLIDPSSIELLSLPRNDRELAQQLEHHWIVPYDNLTYLQDWVSDMLCRAVTGGGIAVRKLYSDDEDTILQFKRCILLNGINVAAQRGDLLDRSTLIGLTAMAPEKRRTEEELIGAFENDLPKILAGFLNVLSKALKLYPTVKLEGYQRLADFNRYGTAIAIALGRTKEEFVNAYADKVKAQNEEALNADPAALALLKFCENEVKGKSLVSIQGSAEADCWKGQPSELHAKLSQYAQQTGIDIKAKGWPKTPNALTRRINDVSPALRAFGCEITSYPGTPRQIKIDASKLASKKQEQWAIEENMNAKPTWYVKNLSQGAKCECGALNVTVELTEPSHEVIKRCTLCYEKLKQSFPNAIWKPAYQEMPSFNDKEAP
jgi:hypothetical protein